MAISMELAKEIESDIAALSKNDYRRPAMSMNKFIGEFSGILAQAEEDMAALVNAKFDSSKMPKYHALLETLSLAYGDRVGLITDTPEKRAKFDEQMALAAMDRRRLGVVGAHIAEQSKDRKALQNYRLIAKGSGDIDILLDNLGLVALIKEYPKLADGIRPGGVAIDAKYLTDAGNRAVELLSMRGFVIEKGIPQNAAVDRQNRILTLCLQAQSYIKKYANAAFFDNLDYYNSNYASENTRAPEVETAVTEAQPA